MESIKLNKGELNHLLTLIKVNEQDGWYAGNHNQWILRSDKLKDKINKILSNERETVRKHESKKEFVDEHIELDHDFQSILNNMKCNRKPTNERF